MIKGIRTGQAAAVERIMHAAAHQSKWPHAVDSSHAGVHNYISRHQARGSAVVHACSCYL